MVTIVLNQEVAVNTNYITCVEGEFNEHDYIPCKLKSESENNTVTFLAMQVNNIEDESSN
jgi:hypothetical protein